MPANPRRARSKARSRAASSPSPQLRAAPKRRAPAAAKAANTNDAVCRDRLGVALAGGGFRAALFHVGVLRRLAELDLLLYVEVLSTVSGGSIVGVLYMLLLKRELERETGRTVLTQADYGRIIDHLEARLVAGIRRNLRARLLSDPVDLIRVMLFPSRTLGDRMADLYYKHIYADTVRELKRPNPDSPLLLKELLIEPGGTPVGALLPQGDIDSYNRKQAESDGSVVTKLVINATSLNTGTRFLFKATEIGEWQYGYARIDETTDLARRKREIDAILRMPEADRRKVNTGAPPATLARWVITGEATHLTADAGELIGKWSPRFDIEPETGNGRGAGLHAVRTTELGVLRLARLACWHLRKLRNNPTLHYSGGFTAVEHRHDLAVNLGLITHDYAARIEQWFDDHDDLIMRLCGFVDEVYLYRSARHIAASIETDWGRWRLSAAVAASANFPPVFPPLLEYQTYDNLVVSRLGLTDGGVYDNLGVMGLLNEGCNFIISSDTGLIDKAVQHVSQGHIGMMGRIASITTDNAARQMRNRLVDRHQVSAGLESAYWAANRAKPRTPSLVNAIELVHTTRRLQGYIGMRIDSPVVVEFEAQEDARLGDGKGPGFNAATVGDLRTDLDFFGDIEVNALINQGYANAGLYVKQWLDYGTRTGEPDDRPPHARDRYGATACKTYPYRGAGDGSYRDARLSPHHRPIANTVGGRPDPQDTRAARVLRAGRRKVLRVLQCGPPWGVGLVLPWVVVIALALGALVGGWRVVSEGGRWEHLHLDLPAISASAVYWAAVLLVLYLLIRWTLKHAINRGIDWATAKGRPDCARRLAAMRRWPARLVFWLALAALALTGAAFLPTALERSLVEQLETVTRNLAIEVAVVVGLAFIIAIAGWLMWLDGWLAAVMQRLNNTKRPSATGGR